MNRTHSSHVKVITQTDGSGKNTNNIPSIIISKQRLIKAKLNEFTKAGS